MKREIRFRGKRADNGEWVYGDLLHVGGDNPRIIEDADNFDDSLYDLTGESVKPDTIGQYTGLKDKDGKEIYEGDIVEFTKIDAVTLKRITTIGYVSFEDGLYSVCNGFHPMFASLFATLIECTFCYVIGNIHDNPSCVNVYWMRDNS